MPVALSVLDLIPVAEGASAGEAFRNAVSLARLTDKLGFMRYWVAEHHHTPGIASAAPAVIISHLAGQTKSIRLGAGGVLLPYHPPLIVAEQFLTLAALYPNRIDLGLGRGPRFDARALQALRADARAAQSFGDDVHELMTLLRQEGCADFPHFAGTGSLCPWILGASVESAQFAALSGMRFAFAAQFSPAALAPAVNIYRSQFRASRDLSESHVMIGVNVVVANTDSAALRLFTSHQQFFTNQVRGLRGNLPAPIENIEDYWSLSEKKYVRGSLYRSFVGSIDTVRSGLQMFLNETQADELIAVTMVHDHEARSASYEALAKIALQLNCSSPSKERKH